MDDKPPQETPRVHDYPFSYPEPIPCSEEKRREYEEIGERIVEQLKRQRGRRSRWRPRES